MLICSPKWQILHQIGMMWWFAGPVLPVSWPPAPWGDRLAVLDVFYFWTRKNRGKSRFFAPRPSLMTG